MNNACSLFCVNIFPGNDFVVDILLCVKFREAGFKVKSDKLRALKRSDNLKLILAEIFDCVLSKDNGLLVALDLYFNVVNFRIDGKGNV